MRVRIKTLAEPISYGKVVKIRQDDQGLEIYDIELETLGLTYDNKYSARKWEIEFL